MQLRTSNEHHELQAEELKASNEELQAMNEELRSAAEELETSKEELQSINEELRTVNQELKVKVEEVSLTSNNLQNLVNSTDIATIFLNRSFRVQLFSPSARELFNLIPTDYGRPLSDITHRLEYPDLMKDAETVLDKLNTIEREVRTTDGRIFTMRVLPYRTAEDRIDGVVVTFFNVTERKRAEEAVEVELKDTSLLHELSARLTNENSLVLYEDILTTAIELMHADAGTVQIFDPVQEKLLLLATQGFEETMTSHFAQVEASSNTSCGIALTTGERTFVNFDDAETDDPEGSRQKHLEAGYISAQSTPLIARSGKPIGMLSTHWRKRYRPIERELRFLDLLARQVADLIEQRQADEVLRQKMEELMDLNRTMIGRELRMIDLKKEVNELCARLGEAERYPLEFEQGKSELQP